jgi:N-acetylglucosamine-6-phosphate deacetylase
VLTLDLALKNFVAYTGASIESALPLVTQNPAAMTGLSRSAGAIRVGEAADFVVLDANGALQASIIQGLLHGAA